MTQNTAIALDASTGVRIYSKGAYSIEEAGRLFFGMSKAAAYKAAEEGRIPTVRISERRRVVTADAIDRLLHSQSTFPSNAEEQGNG
jgi:hypothetical protein